VTGFDDPEMQDLLGLAARLGRDPLVVQGPGGNISLKRDGVMWVKASGTWMMEATSPREKRTFEYLDLHRKAS
jgi:rhamnose utilization protein RhaD (predicted bifunctional aldolase and dehydrogenase)